LEAQSIGYPTGLRTHGPSVIIPLGVATDAICATEFQSRPPMTSPAPPIVPELDVSDLDRSLVFYREILGFEMRVERPEERFVYLTRGFVHLMLEEAAGPGRRFRTAPLEYPYGRGINLQIEVPDIDHLYTRAVEAGATIHIPLEERWYRQGEDETGNRQFVLVDPDGYLLRFFTDLGRRSARKTPT
jgi:catechol 2,3-dioxygenase-like lactoylglutathione lyase family enzyme